MKTLIIISIIFLFVLPAQAQYSGGTGEPNEPYQIDTAEDLMLLGESPEDYDKHFSLTADIDLDPNLPGGRVFDRAVIAPDMNDTEDGYQGTSFSGVFDGNGHTISHMTITGGWYLGLFGNLDSGAKISNLGLETVDVNGVDHYIGGLVGISGSLRDKPAVLTNCYSAGKVTGTTKVGGLVGENNFGTIVMCFSTCEVRGGGIVGGLIGDNGGSDLFFGGIVINSYSTGMVSAEGRVGGLIGANGGLISTSYSTGTVNGTGGYVGGLVGQDHGIIITTSYSTGAVTGNNHVGGLVGFSYGQIAASYSTGTVTGDKYVGGLVGYMYGSIITTSYSTGKVDGNKYIGGLVGDKYVGTVADSFWDIETSEQAISISGIGKTTAEMQDIETYLSAGWDFIDETRNGACDYWRISPGDYPKLHYPVMPEGLGTAKQPYLIRDARDLGTVWLNPLAYYRLEASVDLSGIKWPMAVVPWFGGSFDGNNNVISNLCIQGSENLGLFGQLGSGSKVSDLGLEVIDVNGVTGIAVIPAVGGLVGNNDGGSISRCYSNGTVSGTGDVGGLVGHNGYSKGSDAVLADCYSTAAVSGGYRVGGLAGSNDKGSITSCFSAGTVTGIGDVGGLIGNNFVGSITDSYSTGRVRGDEVVGGLVGYNSDSNITMSYSSSDVSCGDWTTGGLVGWNHDGSIAMSYSTGTISGNWHVGGLVGINEESSINTSYSSCAVTGYGYIGGLVGHNMVSDITMSYSSGVVVGNENVGGLVAYNNGSIISSFWDMESSGQTISAGGEGKTTAEMQTASTFLDAGWDFVDETENGADDIWWIDEGNDYPRLWWELIPKN